MLPTLATMGIDCPVIYIEKSQDGALVLTMRPTHRTLVRSLTEGDPRWATARLEPAREIFATAGTLVQ
jgi:hypothetical protein